MAKQRVTLPLTLPPREHGTPAYRWLGDALRAAILSGQLAPGARLPATRDLACQYELSRGTIVSAFEQLRAEGYVDGTVGSGTYVNRVLPDDLLDVARSAARRGRSRAPAADIRTAPPRRRLSRFAREARLFPTSAGRATRAFRADEPALDLFPTQLWGQLASRRVRAAPATLLRGCGPLGFEPLREAVAAYLATSRGVKCTTAQVAIVSGVQEALGLTARLLLDPGDRVCMEEPGYVGASLVFEAAGARVIPVPLDEHGMRIPGARARDARLAYVTPAHQFPVGISMTLSRRLGLLEWARQTGAMIFEDDHDSEYRYAGRPLPALQGLDRHGVVIFAGSFSKVLFPSLRLGYLVAPPDLLEPLAAAISLGARHAPLLEQAVLCDFITGGHFARHIRRMREVYAHRRSVLLACAEQQLAGLLEITGVEAGLQTAGWLGDGIDSTAVALAASARGVDVTPLSRFSRGALPREGLQLGFAAIDEHELARGVTELARTLESMRRPRS